MSSSTNSERDPAERGQIEPPSRPAQLIVLLYLLSAVAYLGWRATTLNPAAPIFSRLFYGAELLAFAVSLLDLFVVWKLRRRPLRPAPPDLAVDLLIVTDGEPAEHLRRALLAAGNLDYPHATWLLDDGDRAELRILAAEFGAHHLASPSAGASSSQRINAALAGSNAEFVAVLAADHAAKRSLLDATLGHFRDPRVAFVQTAIDFPDAAASRPRGFGGHGPCGLLPLSPLVQRGRDCSNSALYGGSGVVFRRAAIDLIGGFPDDRPDTALDLSLAVHKAGLHSVFVADPQVFGIAAASPRKCSEHQWPRGLTALRLLFRETLFLRGSLSPAQRLNYLATTLAGLNGWQQMLCYAAPVWILMEGSLPIDVSPMLFAALFLGLRLLRVLADDEASRGHRRWQLIGSEGLKRFASRVRSQWRSTQALIATQQVRGSQLRPNLSAISRRWPQLLVAAANAGAVLLAVLLVRRGGIHALSSEGLITAVLWASLNVVVATQAMAATVVGLGEQRQARRFAIPLPADLDIDGGRITMTVDNLSLAGARLYGNFPGRLRSGDAVSGYLHLPGDTLPFSGTVAALLKPDKPSRDGQYHAALGIAFRWPDRGIEDRLSLFLYGSDLQWRFQRQHDDARTSRERIVARFRKAAIDPLAGKHWAAIRYDVDDQTRYGLISAASSPGPRVVATGHPLPADETLHVSKFSRRQPQGLRITAHRELARLSTPTATLYLTEVRTAPILETAASPMPAPLLRQLDEAPS